MENYPEFHDVFPPERLSQTSEFVAEESSFRYPSFGNEGSGSDFDNSELPSPFYTSPHAIPSAQTEAKDDRGSDQLPKRRGPKTNSTFTHSPHGELGHPWIDWRLDKASMEEYMPKYAMQEGFAVDRIKEKKGTVHRWKCHHAGKYDNWRKQPDQITDKKVVQEMVNAGNPFVSSVTC